MLSYEELVEVCERKAAQIHTYHSALGEESVYHASELEDPIVQEKIRKEIPILAERYHPILCKDWFDDRSEDSFVHHIEEKLDWESHLEEENFSSFIHRTAFLSTKDILLEGVTLARKIVNAYPIPFRIGIKVDPENSYTDKKSITLSTKIFDEESLSSGHRLDVFCGFAAHEAGHVVYTDFDVLVDYFEEDNPSMYVKQLLNLIEDERFEREMGYEFPGFVNYIAACKTYIFGMLSEIMEEGKEDKALPMPIQFFNLLIKFIRFPASYSVEDCVQFIDLIEGTKEILTPYPDSTLEALEAAKRIYELLAKEYKKELDEEAAARGRAEKEMGEVKKMLEKLVEGIMGKIEQILASSSELPGGVGAEVHRAKERIPSTSAMDKPKVMPSEILSRSLIDSLDGHVESPSKNVYFSEVKGDKYQYQEDREEVIAYASTVAKLIDVSQRNYMRILRSQRTGDLDTSKLVDVALNIPTVYRKDALVRTKKVDLCLLIDQSGSMGGSEIRMARKGAVLLREAINRCRNMTSYIYGHTADIRESGSTELFIYKEGRKEVPYALGSVTARSENRDGVAILETAKRVRKLSKNHCIMFVIADGNPAARDYGGSSAIKDVKEKVIETEKMGFHVVHIGVGSGVDSEEMFKHFIKLENFHDFPRQLGQLMKKVIKQIQTRQNG